jgi:hypothetical protein
MTRQKTELPSIEDQFNYIIDNVKFDVHETINWIVINDHILHAGHLINHLQWRIKTASILVSFGYVFDKEGYYPSFEIKVTEDSVETKLLELYTKDDVINELNFIMNDILPEELIEMTEESNDEIVNEIQHKTLFQDIMSKFKW